MEHADQHQIYCPAAHTRPAIVMRQTDRLSVCRNRTDVEGQWQLKSQGAQSQSALVNEKHQKKAGKRLSETVTADIRIMCSLSNGTYCECTAVAAAAAALALSAAQTEVMTYWSEYKFKVSSPLRKRAPDIDEN